GDALQVDRHAATLTDDQIADVAHGSGPDVDRADQDVDLAVALQESGRHLALDLVAHRGGDLVEVEPETRQLLAVEGQLQLGVADLHGRLDVHQTRYLRDLALQGGGRRLQVGEIVAVGLDLDRRAEGEIRRPLELVARDAGGLQPRAQDRRDLLLVAAPRAFLETHLDARRVLSLAARLRQRQTGSADDAGEGVDALVVLEDRLDVLHEAVG